MSERRLTIETPSGEKLLFAISSTDGDPFLADWLEAHSLSLNTRCGGKGICRGCRVELIEDGCVTPRRGCQMRLADMPETLECLRIPDVSWRDQSLHGISVFEVRAEPRPPCLRPGLGLALDIGTTTVAGALWDLSSGQCLSTAALPNAQRRYGDNVLSRIDHAMTRGGDSSPLQEALVKSSLEPLITRLCEQAQRKPGELTEATATGNTVMLHALAAASLAGLGAYPFKPVFLEQRTLNAREVGLGYDFSLTLLPCLGPFVGADIAAGALAAGMMEQDGPSMLIDFGTNGEILLRYDGGVLATATAAGPAFEGGRLSWGAPAGRGVVSSLARQDGHWSLALSENAGGAPVGISGAAYVDFLALALAEGMITPMGRFDRQHPEVLLCQEESAGPGSIRVGARLEVTEADVAELMQAKAAIAGGVITLLELAGMGPGDLQSLFVAGGFGYHLNLGHALATGLLPPVARERIHVIGNASLGGASLMLLGAAGEALDPLIRNCRVVELNQIASFEDHFIDSMSLVPLF